MHVPVGYTPREGDVPVFPRTWWASMSLLWSFFISRVWICESSDRMQPAANPLIYPVQYPVQYPSPAFNQVQNPSPAHHQVQYPSPSVRTDIVTVMNQANIEVADGRSGPADTPPETLVMREGQTKGEDENAEKKIGDSSSDASEVDWDSAPGVIGKIAKLIHDRYLLVFFGFLFIVVLTVMLTLVALPVDERCVEGGGNGQMQVCESSEYDWTLSFAEASKRKDGVTFARAQSAIALEQLSANALGTEPRTEEEPRRTAHDLMNLRLLFWYEDEADNKDRSIFTPKKVKDMCEIEALLTAHPFYKHLCVLDDNAACTPQKFSVAARFYPAEQLDPANGGCTELSAAEIEGKSAALAADFSGDGAFFASIDAVDGGFTNASRALLELGAPLEGYVDDDDRATEQSELYNALFVDTECGGSCDDDDDKCKAIARFCSRSGIEDGATVKGVETLLFERYNMEAFPSSGQYEGAFGSPYGGAEPKEEYDDEPDMAVRFWSEPLQREEFSRVVSGDLNFAILSIVVVGCYIWFHTGSAMIATLSMFQIVMSLPFGYFFYYNVFGIKFYTQINILVVYLALGIGADSVFVMSDAWNQSRGNPDIKTVLGRLTFSIHRTATSCFNTTLTTVFSFVSTTFTPALPIYCFAVFAALVISVNYLFVCLFTPTVIMFQHVHFSDQGGLCCYCSKKPRGRLGAKEPVASADLQALRDKDKMYKTCCYSRFAAPDMDPEAGAISEGSLSRSERFFREYVFGIINFRVGGVKVGALACVCVCLAYAIGMATQAFRLTPPSSEEEWFPSSHMFNGDLTARLFNNWRGSSDNGYMAMAFMFGIDSVDRDGFIRFFPADDRGTVVYDPKFDLSREESQLFFMRTCDEVATATCDAEACEPSGRLVHNDLTCVVRDLLEHYKTIAPAPDASVIPQAAFTDTVVDFFTNPDNALSPQDLQARSQQYQRVIGLDGQSPPRVLWAAVTFRSSMSLPMTNSQSREAFDFVEELADTLAEQAPDGMGSLYQTDTQVSGQGWTWLDVENALVQNLLTGFTICFPVAFLVLVFATGNLLIASFATTSIALIVGGVLGAAKAYYAWDLGIAESVAGVIVIGFSVDYTVHLGHMYKEGSGTREERTQHALTYMGTTVIGGGLTTLSAGLVLFLCTLTFFTKMALLLVWTILLSVIYALFFFMPLCLLFGPQGTLSELPSPKQLIEKCRKRAV